MNQDDSILQTQATEVVRHVDNALRWSKELKSVLAYTRNDHTGMIRGDGELTRYMNYLASNCFVELCHAQDAAKRANFPEPLPF